MQIITIYNDNSLRNYSYLLGCDITKKAVVIDPLDAHRCLQLAMQQGYDITHIINTHEHWDHIAGNEELADATGAQIIAHANATIDGVTRRVKAGDIIEVGKTINLRVLDTPGHTLSHICLFVTTPTPVLFCGDTLFNAGCGNCHNGGNVEKLYETFSQQLSKLPDETQIYPGHDYIKNNLEFALARSPNNATLKKWLEKVKDHDPHVPIITTLAIEKTINPFFQLSNQVIIQQLSHDFPQLESAPSEKEVFICLRRLRNDW